MSNHYQFAQGVELLNKLSDAHYSLSTEIGYRCRVTDMRSLIAVSQTTLAECSALARAASDLADWLKSVEEKQ